jgi:hypothetical protein
VAGVAPSAAKKYLDGEAIPKPEIQYLIAEKWPDIPPPFWQLNPIKKSKNPNGELPQSDNREKSVKSTLENEAPDDLTTAGRLAAARLEIRFLAEQLEANPESELDRLARALGPLRERLPASVAELLPSAGQGPSGALERAHLIEAGLTRLRDVAHAERDLILADRCDVTRARVARLVRKLTVIDVPALLRGAAWGALVGRVAGALRDDSPALEAVRGALESETDSFAVALREVLANVRHIRWPCPRYADDVQGFCREILGFELYEKQLDVVALLGSHDQVAVASGHRVGKTRLIAAVALWWFCTFPDARVIMTAPGGRQLEQVLWREVRALVAGSGRCLDCRKNDPQGPRPCVHSQKIEGVISDRALGGLLASDGRQIIGFSSANTEAAAGYAAARLLVIVDEASGVRDEIFDALAGNRAGAGSKLLMTGNPTKLSGRFYEAFFKRADSYATIRIASTDTPNYQTGENVIPGLASREFVERSKQEYGEDSAFYLVRVLGQHAIGDEAKLFPLSILLEAQERWNDTAGDGPLCIGVDCAGGTDQGDFSAFCVRRGQKILHLESLKLATAEDHLQHVLGLVRRFDLDPNSRQKVRVVVDADGAIGVTIAAHLESGSKRLDVVRHHGHVILSRSTQYATRRDECIANASNWLKRGGAIPADVQLEAELNLLALEVIEIGGFDRTRVTSKKEIRKALRRSSDRADAFCMAVWDPETRAGYGDSSGLPDDDELDADDLPVLNDPWAGREVFERGAGGGLSAWRHR